MIKKIMINRFLQRFTSSRGPFNTCSRLKQLSAKHENTRTYARTLPLWQDEKNYESESKGSFWPWSKKENNRDKLTIIKPQTICSETDRVFDPECKIAIVLGGATGMGLAAADSLLCHGARVVILADEDPRVGGAAAQSLCDFYGKNRARYLRCDLCSSCQLEDVFEESICRYKKVDVLFSNLDRNNAGARVNGWLRAADIAENNHSQSSNTARAINAGIKYMGLSDNDDNAGGIIVSGASILGFMGWPEDPSPVYCFNKEPVAETTMDLANIYPVEKTGVRIVAILMSRKPFAEIGLPDFPPKSNCSHNTTNYVLSTNCESPPEFRIETALIHIIERGSTGSTWLAEPDPYPREIPWQIHFPAEQGEHVDPKIYEEQMQNCIRGVNIVLAAILECSLHAIMWLYILLDSKLINCAFCLHLDSTLGFDRNGPEVSHQTVINSALLTANQKTIRLSFMKDKSG